MNHFVKQIIRKSSECLAMYILDFPSMGNTCLFSKKGNSELQEKKTNHLTFFLYSFLLRLVLEWPIEELS